MPRLAIREDLLSGQTTMARFEHAVRLGTTAVELSADGLGERIDEVVEAMAATGVEIAAIDHGRRDGILHIDPVERERALAELRQSICDAADLGASGVVFVPHFGALILPDLTPFLSAEALAAELLLSHLRTLEDYAAAMGVSLFIRSLRQQESAFLCRFEAAAAVARKRNHPSVRVAAGTLDLHSEGLDIPAALRAGAHMLGYLYISAVGLDVVDLAVLTAALEANGYNGWVTLESRAPHGEHDLSAAVASLRASGFA
ncbi:MAG: TIM barrel protein [Anaerolineae bacterium]|nr:TIM barrel protein [Anaerolineae bacterium]